jgi:uncharacterized protein (TIGR01777 family)
MRIAITGAGGLVGNALRARLVGDGHEVIRVGRYTSVHPPDVRWSIPHGQLNGSLLEGLDAVVHLAGEPIIGKWTPDKKQAIRASRVDGTRLLAATLANLQRKPAVLISASAVGNYGDRGDEVLDESSSSGGGYLADVCQAWESAAQPAAGAGIRVVHPRLGVVISRDGGALKMMLPAFRMGVGGPLGNGRQWMSWIGLDDVIGAMLHLIEDSSVSGPVNLVSPEPVTNTQFTRTLASVLRRQAVIPMPRFTARLAFGELADEVLFASQRVEPGALQRSGYAFRQPRLQEALRAALRR